MILRVTVEKRRHLIQDIPVVGYYLAVLGLRHKSGIEEQLDGFLVMGVEGLRQGHSSLPQVHVLVAWMRTGCPYSGVPYGFHFRLHVAGVLITSRRLFLQRPQDDL